MKLSKRLSAEFDNTEVRGESVKQPTIQSLETSPSDAMDKWMKNAIIANKRMTEDDEYRKQIAKYLS